MTQFKYTPSAVSKIVFLGGIHGVGKNTLCSSIKESLEVTHLSASEILKWGEISPDMKNKKVKNVDETQNRLIAGLREVIEPSKNYVIDGHFCLLMTDGEISTVPFETFRAINPCAVVVLTEKPSLVLKRLVTRDNKDYSIEQLKLFQQKEIEWAKEVAAKLTVPYIELNGSEIELFNLFWQNHLRIRKTNFNLP